jgi:hypothetical protein
MRKVGLALLFLLGFAAAGGLSASVVAGTTTTGTTSTAPQTIAPGVTISGVDVGDMTAADAFTTVTASFARPLLLDVPQHRLAVAPARCGPQSRARWPFQQTRRSSCG